jgi:hypothetical protein
MRPGRGRVSLLCGLAATVALGVPAALAHDQSTRGRAASEGLTIMPSTESPAPSLQRSVPGGPPPEAWDDPARNADDFSTMSPEVTRAARAVGHTSRRRPSPRAHASHLVVCLAYASTTRGNYRYVAHGSATCSGTVDMLSAKACIDLWSTGGYWTTLGCSEWTTRVYASTITAEGYGRSCTGGRIYRAAAVVSGFHHVAASNTDYAPSHDCGSY